MKFDLYGFKNFDELLAFHCAPALTGIKPANLFSCPIESMTMIAPLLSEYTKKFSSHGIAFEVICRCNTRALILVYQPQLLEDYLRQDDVIKYLQDMGYQQNSLGEMLQTLGIRVANTKDFPHEIGVFLGYPLNDIKGFVANQGKNCKYSGYWKVYGDVEHAKGLFNAYNASREKLLNIVAKGVPLHLAAESF